jgi:hypothetical protein
MKYFLEPSEPWAVINHPLQPWMLKAHILAAPFLVFALGLITPGHIWKQLQSPVRRNRISGAATLWTIFPMVVTGYFIQAVTDPEWLSGVAWSHIATGAIYLLGMVFHGGIPGRSPRH